MWEFSERSWENIRVVVTLCSILGFHTLFDLFAFHDHILYVRPVETKKQRDIVDTPTSAFYLGLLMLKFALLAVMHAIL